MHYSFPTNVVACCMKAAGCNLQLNLGLANFNGAQLCTQAICINVVPKVFNGRLGSLFGFLDFSLDLYSLHE